MSMCNQLPGKSNPKWEPKNRNNSSSSVRLSCLLQKVRLINEKKGKKAAHITKVRLSL